MAMKNDENPEIWLAPLPAGKKFKEFKQGRVRQILDELQWGKDLPKNFITI